MIRDRTRKPEAKLRTRTRRAERARRNAARLAWLLFA